VFEDRDIGVSLRKLSSTHSIGCPIAEHWYQHDIKRPVADLSSKQCHYKLSIDEHFFAR
jgi:hypothetical protein